MNFVVRNRPVAASRRKVALRLTIRAPTQRDCVGWAVVTTTVPRESTEQPPRNAHKVASLTGWLMVITFVTSIPAYFVFYAPLRETPESITGSGIDPTSSIALGALLELILIVANVGTAVVPYAIFR